MYPIQVDFRPIILLALVSALPLIAVPPVAAKLTGSQVQKVIRESGILDSKFSVSANVSGGEVHISTYRHPEAEDNDLKINSVLMSKALMDKDPAGIERVRISFYEMRDRSRYKQIVVSAGQIKKFASGALSQSALLSALKVSNHANPFAGAEGKSYGQIVNSAGRGPLYKERQEVLDRITTLRRFGVPVGNLKSAYLRIEERAHGGASVQEISSSLNQLKSQLSSLESNLKKAGKQAVPGPATPGHNLPGSHGSTTSTGRPSPGQGNEMGRGYPGQFPPGQGGFRRPRGGRGLGGPGHFPPPPGGFPPRQPYYEDD